MRAGRLQAIAMQEGPGWSAQVGAQCVDAQVGCESNTTRQGVLTNLSMALTSALQWYRVASRTDATEASTSCYANTESSQHSILRLPQPGTESMQQGSRVRIIDQASWSRHVSILRG